MHFTTALSLFATSSFGLVVNRKHPWRHGDPSLLVWQQEPWPILYPFSASCCGSGGLLSQYCNEAVVCNSEEDAPTVWWYRPKSKFQCSTPYHRPQYCIPRVWSPWSQRRFRFWVFWSRFWLRPGSSSSSRPSSNNDKSGSLESGCNSGHGNSCPNPNSNSNGHGNSKGDNHGNQRQGRPKDDPSQNAATRDSQGEETETCGATPHSSTFPRGSYGVNRA
ncbi:hypothetical protein MY11210_000718 [Beauveria gryllotalpidicola]